MYNSTEQLDRIIELLEKIDAKLARKKRANTSRKPSQLPALLEIADGMDDMFTLQEFKHIIPPHIDVSDKVIGATLCHNGYHKQQIRIGAARRWYYVRNVRKHRYYADIGTR